MIINIFKNLIDFGKYLIYFKLYFDADKLFKQILPNFETKLFFFYQIINQVLLKLKAF